MQTWGLRSYSCWGSYSSAYVLSFGICELSSSVFQKPYSDACYFSSLTQKRFLRKSLSWWMFLASQEKMLPVTFRYNSSFNKRCHLSLRVLHPKYDCFYFHCPFTSNISYILFQIPKISYQTHQFSQIWNSKDGDSLLMVTFCYCTTSDNIFLLFLFEILLNDDWEMWSFPPVNDHTRRVRPAFL